MPEPAASPDSRHDHAIRWEDALDIAKVLRVSRPTLGGIHLKARAGPVRHRWMDYLQLLAGKETPWQKITPQTTPDRLLGGIDIATTLRLGKPAYEKGVLERAHGGFLVLAMAERMEPATAAIIARVMDEGWIQTAGKDEPPRPARFTVIAIDEGADEGETIPSVLADRLGLYLPLEQIAWHDTQAPTPGDPLPDPASVSAVDLPKEFLEFFSALPFFAGRLSLRPTLNLCKVARTLAAMASRDTVGKEDAARAVRFCLGNIEMPAPPDETEEQQPPPPPADEPERADNAEKPEEHVDEIPDEFDVMAEAASRIPLAALARELSRNALRTRMKSGKAGEKTQAARRGRPIGFSPSPPYPDARPDILATIRTAVPWQKLRQRADGQEQQGVNNIAAGPLRLKILPSDFRFKRFKHNATSTAIFVVDASGSTAMERLGETKGAIELLLADCYIRRDQVGLIAFRGTASENVLDPTRSLVRAKRALAGLPGGGPTPLPSGLRNALAMALSERQKGNTPLVVLMTDGSGNISLEGTPDRDKAAEESLALARQFAVAGLRTVVIDIARRPRPAAQALARAMLAEFITLPQANARAVSSLVNDRLGERA